MGTACSCLDPSDDLSPGPDPGSGSHVSESSLNTRSNRQLKGTRVNVFKQDPTVEYIGLRQQWLPVELHRGPRTREVEVMGLSRHYGSTDDKGNYLYDPERDPEAFDAVNTLAVVHNVLWMYRRALRKLKARRNLRWLWGDRPIQVYPRAGRKANAYYSRDEKALKFFYFYDGRKTVYSCRSWDIVSHETGHAVLDGLKPGWLSSSHGQTAALHEAFGDITCIMSILDQLDMCEVIVARSRGQLHTAHNLLAALGEEFGRGTGQAFGIRNAHADYKISEVENQQHELSKVFTGAIYDFLIRVFLNTLDLNARPPAESLYSAAHHVVSLFLLAILKSPDKNATFKDVAETMVREEPQRIFKSFMQMEFGRREIFDPSARPKRRGSGFMAPTSDCIRCGTLSAFKNVVSPENGGPISKDSPRNRNSRNSASYVNSHVVTDTPDMNKNSVHLSDLQVFEEEPSRRWSRSPPRGEKYLAGEDMSSDYDNIAGNQNHGLREHRTDHPSDERSTADGTRI